MNQMNALKRQLQDQDTARMERERLKAQQHIAQLQEELQRMRAQQDELQRALTDRSRIMESSDGGSGRDSPRKANNMTRKRVAELEAECERQKAALKEKDLQIEQVHRQMATLAAEGRATRR